MQVGGGEERMVRSVPHPQQICHEGASARAQLDQIHTRGRPHLLPEAHGPHAYELQAHSLDTVE